MHEKDLEALARGDSYGELFVVVTDWFAWIFQKKV